MLPYSQFSRLMKVTSPLGPEVLLIGGFRGREALSELFCFELDLFTARPFSAPFDKILGQPLGVHIALPNGLTRVFHGMVSRFTQTRQDDTFTHYTAELVPKPWLMTRRSGSRTFQQKSVPEILQEVLLGFDFSLELMIDYPRRDYTVQYNETDFAFASRLMEEEGIGYFFRHEDDRHEMVLFDNSLQLADLPEESTVIYEEVTDGVRDDVRITNWSKSQRICSSEATFWDHSFELPDQHLDAAQAAPSTAKIGQVEHQLPGSDEKLEHYEYPGGYARWFDGVDPGGTARPDDPPKTFEQNDRIAAIRMQEQAAAAFDIKGESNCLHFCPGFKFSLTRHFDGNDKYLLCSVEHDARLSSGFRSEDTAPVLEYSNRFDCLPESLPYRPVRKTPRPAIRGVQTATVVGPEDSELFVDMYGRVKVQFHWDREGKRDGNSSCWVRVAQFWAGPRWGAFFWPRIGHEVVVAFAEGDPDQPLIVGNAYNAANMPPLALPEHQEAGGIKSCSVGEEAAERFNSLIFYDHPGDEHVHIHSETHEAITSEGSKFNRTPGPQIRFCGSLPFGVGSGSGGGELAPSCQLAMADPIMPEQGSGSGGGLLEWPAAIGGFAHWDLAEDYSKLFPGDAKFVYGSQTNSTMLGDRTAHILAGADVRMVVDIEAMITDAVMEACGAGAAAKLVMGGLAGAGGSTAFVCGPNSTLTYAGDQLSVARGPCYQVRSKGDALDLPGKAAKVLAVLTSLATIAGDLVASLLGKHEHGTTTEPPEWAMLLSTALPSRMLAVLIELEKINAETQADLIEAGEGEELSADAIEAPDDAKDLVDAAERRVKALLNKEATNSHKVYDGNYRVRAEDITFISSRNDESDLFGASAIHLEALGSGSFANNGSVFVDATKTVSLSCRGGAGGPKATLTRKEEQGTIKIQNTLPGSIEITQGLLAGPIPAPGSPSVKLSNEPPSIKLQVGLPDVGSSLELSETGLTAKFGLWSLTLNEEGIKLAVGENNIQLTPADIGISAADTTTTLTPASLTTSSPIVSVEAETSYSLESGMVEINGDAVVNVVGAILCLN